ncbi:hypothetical protein [Roseovarius ramblicola]|uniref:Uncharacterized protein n=1 Tax=Roseovarius ramblicola TaxID=2022336 RepID=A0ABV5HYR2_9RHOB
MNRNMKMALADAWPHGLVHVGNGYRARGADGEPIPFSGCHATGTVNALKDRSLIDFWGPERVAHLTDLGRARIEDPELTGGAS